MKAQRQHRYEEKWKKFAEVVEELKDGDYLTVTVKPGQQQTAGEESAMQGGLPKVRQ